MLQKNLARLFPEKTLEIALLDPAFDGPVIYHDDGIKDYEPPVNGQILILSDLGHLAQDGGRKKNFWLHFGQNLHAAGCRPIVLLPCSLRECGNALQQLFTLVSWQHPVSARQSSE